MGACSRQHGTEIHNSTIYYRNNIRKKNSSLSFLFIVFIILMSIIEEVRVSCKELDNQDKLEISQKPFNDMIDELFNDFFDER